MSTERAGTLSIDRFATPIGEALLVTDGDGCLRALDWADYEARMIQLLRRQNGPAALVAGRAPQRIRQALTAYFGGEVAGLRDVSCRFGGTPFQRRVWEALRAVPAGTTISYGAMAARLGVPRAVRAVGHANGANPISVVVPCHRVIGSNGALTGYGGGLARKRWLLRHEGVELAP